MTAEPGKSGSWGGAASRLGPQAGRGCSLKADLLLLWETPPSSFASRGL